MEKEPSNFIHSVSWGQGGP